MAQLIKYSAYILVFISLIGCGGGGGQDGTGRPPSNERQVTSVGTITSDDTLTVNGVEYNTSNATVTIDNEPGTEDELELGQIVTINGVLDVNGGLGVANTISYNANIFGPVDSIDTKEKVLTILGQTIRVTKDTLFSANNLTGFNDIEESAHLKIVGFVLDDGSLAASYIEKVDFVDGQLPGVGDNPLYEVNGSVKNINEIRMTFQVNDLTINYSNIILLEDLKEGDPMEVLGSQFDSNNNFIGVEINPIVIDFGETNDLFELEGFITEKNIISGYFEIDGERIHLTVDTVFVGGDLNTLDKNIRVEVEGQLNSDKELVAEKIIFLTATLTSHSEVGPTGVPVTTWWNGKDWISLTWRDVDADGYRLVVSNNETVVYDQYYNSTTTVALIESLPANGTFLDFTLYTLRDDVWSSKTYNFYMSGRTFPPARFISPGSPVDRLMSNELDFIWTNSNADEYRLVIAHEIDRSLIIYDQTFDEQINSVTVFDLPTNGARLVATLYSRHDLVWGSADHTLFFNSQNILDYNAELTSHTNGDRLTSSTEYFSWGDVGADEYRVTISDGGKVFYEENFDAQTTFVTINDLPIARTAFRFTIYTRRGNGWGRNVYFLSSAGMWVEARITSHRHNERLDSDQSVFTWNDVDADRYRFSISNITDEVIYDEYFGGDITSIMVRDLPINNARLDVRLYTFRNGEWSLPYRLRLLSQYVLRNAFLQSPSGDELPSDSVTFIWSDVGADEYRFVLQIRNQDAPETLSVQYSTGTNTSLRVNNIPTNGEYLRATLFTRFGSSWGFTSRQYRGQKTPLIGSELLSHESGDTLTDNQMILEWSDAGGTNSYLIEMFRDDGTSFYKKTFSRQNNSTIINNLPTTGEELTLILTTRSRGSGNVERTYTFTSMKSN